MGHLGPILFFQDGTDGWKHGRFQTLIKISVTAGNLAGSRHFWSPRTVAWRFITRWLHLFTLPTHDQKERGKPLDFAKIELSLLTCFTFVDEISLFELKIICLKVFNFEVLEFWRDEITCLLSFLPKNCTHRNSTALFWCARR